MDGHIGAIGTGTLTAAVDSTQRETVDGVDYRRVGSRQLFRRHMMAIGVGNVFGIERLAQVPGDLGRPEPRAVGERRDEVPLACIVNLGRGAGGWSKVLGEAGERIGIDENLNQTAVAPKHPRSGVFRATFREVLLHARFERSKLRARLSLGISLERPFTIFAFAQGVSSQLDVRSCDGRFQSLFEVGHEDIGIE